MMRHSAHARRRGGLVLGLAGAGLLLLPATSALAADLALKRVVLSSGGVGYYEYEAAIGADETVTLDVPLDQIDDILGSLIAQSDQGRVAVAELPGREPLAQYFAGRSFPQAALASPAALLNALVGAEIAADGPRPVRGKLVRVVAEATVDKDGRAGTARNRVTVLAAGGLQQFILEEADAVSFTDPAVQAEIGDALGHIAAFRAGDRRRITLTLPGSAGHPVRVGYVVAAPLWKTSYRLLLPTDGTAAPARLQGWAVLENRSGNDWKDVSLTLVSGSPVTFRQALYQSYMVPRPTIAVDLGTHVLPQADRGRIGQLEKAEPDGAPPPPPPPAPMMAKVAPAPGAIGGNFSRALRPLAPAMPAEAVEAPSQVSFTLPGTVTLASGRSATLPIIDTAVAGDRVSLYQPATSRANPLAAVTVKNAGATAWPPGMLTLYEQQPGDQGVLFVGDAQLNAVAAGESRFVSYAVDLKTRIAVENRHETVLARIAPADGVLQETFVERDIATYRLTGGPQARRLVLEVPRPSGARLVAPTGADIELTTQSWRIPVSLAPTEQRTLIVTVETDRREAVQITEDAADSLTELAGDGTIAPLLKTRLQPIVALRRSLSEATDAADTLDQERKDIVADQERLRANMAALQADASLRKRYIDKLAAEEGRLDALVELRRAAAERVRAARARLLQALATLTV